MHLFGCVIDMPQIERAALTRELSVVGEDLGLDARATWSASSTTSRVLVAGMHHGLAARPRSYVSVTPKSVTLFDGLPVANVPVDFDERDSSQLGQRWDALPGLLEGQFAAVRVDLTRDTVEVLLDTLGLVPVFVARRGSGWALSNSALALARLLGERAPDGLAIASFLGFGWASERRTLLETIRALSGGSLHRFNRHGQTRVHYGPAELARRPRPAVTRDELTQRLVEMTAAASRGISVVRCPLTAGRDTRLLAALLRATGAEVAYYTEGRPEDADVRFGRAIARFAGLEYQLITPEPADPAVDWTRAADSFITRSDGLSTLEQLHDHIHVAQPVEQLSLKLWGVGAEIARGRGDLGINASNLPIVGPNAGVQRRLLGAKIKDDGLATSAARALLDGYLDRFIATRRAEGWPTRELTQAFFIFERLGCWGATGPRRAAAGGDVFSPFCSRVYADYCHSVDIAARYVEMPHFQLMTQLAADLRDFPYEIPWLPQRPHLASVFASRRLASVIAGRLRGRLSRSSGDQPRAYDAYGSFEHEWLEARLELAREICLQPESAVWEFIDRKALEALLCGPLESRLARWAGLMRALTVCWFFNRTI
jgi:asparagine synthase (glutamine-hydrolysing)